MHLLEEQSIPTLALGTAVLDIAVEHSGTHPAPGI